MAARSTGMVVEGHAAARAHVNPLENYFRYGPISLLLLLDLPMASSQIR
jgi:hypothetical protein